MKKAIYFLMMLALHLSCMACPVCERNQPKLLKGIVHGSGPESSWDYISMWGMVMMVLITLIFSIKWLLKPNETSNDHIKNSILNIE